MNIIAIILMSISVSVDAFIVGLSYGIQKIYLSPLSKIIIGMCTVIYTIISLLLGRLILTFLSVNIERFLGSAILITIGLYSIIKSLRKEKIKPLVINNMPNKDKEHRFYFKRLKMTIQIIEHAELGDSDNSHSIEPIEALLIGLALSLDSISVGIASSIAGISTSLLPFIFAIVQVFLLSLGTKLGLKFSFLDKNKKNLLIIAGIILIGLGIYKII